MLGIFSGQCRCHYQLQDGIKQRIKLFWWHHNIENLSLDSGRNITNGSKATKSRKVFFTMSTLEAPLSPHRVIIFCIVLQLTKLGSWKYRMGKRGQVRWRHDRNYQWNVQLMNSNLNLAFTPFNHTNDTSSLMKFIFDACLNELSFKQFSTMAKHVGPRLSKWSTGFLSKKKL
jgi:hypothetical protein